MDLKSESFPLTSPETRQHPALARKRNSKPAIGSLPFRPERPHHVGRPEQPHRPLDMARSLRGCPGSVRGDVDIQKRLFGLRDPAVEDAGKGAQVDLVR